MNICSRQPTILLFILAFILSFSLSVHAACEANVISNVVGGGIKLEKSIEGLREVHPDLGKPKRYKVYLDVSVPEVHAIDVWKVKDSGGRYLNGSGVAIGIIDTGIDYAHPDFYFPNGSSKILAIWDQTLDGKPPKELGYGYECTRKEIEDNACPEEDIVGHGTHVASIAAGTGRAGRYVGVAPGAYLIVVKSGYPACNGTQWFMDEDKIIDGLYYLVGKAREYGLRLVINLSLGSDLGGHDGSSAFEKVLEKLIDGGVIVVAAAGNSGDERVHAMGLLNIERRTFLRWFIPPLTYSFGLSLWLDHGDEVALSLKTPSNVTVHAPIINESVDGVVVNLEKNVYDTGVEWLLDLSSNRSLPSLGWALEINTVKTEGSRLWHAWISSDTCSSYREGFLPGEGYYISQNYTIAIPATSHRVIAVGGYATKSTWRNYLGEVLNTSHEIGEILSFSSRGPTRDGRIKPEIVAPGSVIVAARPASEKYSRLDIDRYYTAKHGTSMSTPHVTGVVAIILQFKPNASHTEVVKAIESSARWSEEYGERPNNLFGWGKLDARVFYNVSVRLRGLPEEVVTTIYVNNSSIDASVNKPFEKLFLRGSIQEIKIQKMVELSEEGVRYLVERDYYLVENSRDIVVNYIPEYYLEVESEIGGEYGSGWYKKDEVAVFSAREYIFPEGLQVLLKPIYRLSGWIDDEGEILLENRILMNKPHKVKALYTEDYSMLYIGWTMIFSDVILTIVIILKYIKSREEKSRTDS